MLWNPSCLIMFADMWRYSPCILAVANELWHYALVPYLWKLSLLVFGATATVLHCVTLHALGTPTVVFLLWSELQSLQPGVHLLC